MKKYDLVVARYNEDISWLSKELDLNNYNLIIYNKGEQNIDFPSIQCENVGGDAETYIRYIVEHYENLPEFMIFIQGYPFDHDAELLDKIRNHSDEPFVPLSDHICVETIDGWYEYLMKRRPAECPVYLLKEAAYALLGNETPYIVTFAAGQQFIVAKEIVLRRSKEFYQKILNRFQFDFILPWDIERLWATIWRIQYVQSV
jgi:hypothetical protein